MINIETLRALNQADKIAITEHARKRIAERNIKIDDVMKYIEFGEIIRQYEDDKPFPSCLILGKSKDDKFLHVVASTDDEYIYFITAYYPDSEQWEPDYKTRRRI